MRKHFGLRGLFALAALMALAACEVVGDADGVQVRYPRYQPLIAEIVAERHCAENGRVARHVATSEERHLDLFVLSSRTGTFVCEDP